MSFCAIQQIVLSMCVKKCVEGLQACDDNKKACKRVRLRKRVSVLGRLVSSEKACERARLVGFVLEGV
jgi:hypothetical protein